MKSENKRDIAKWFSAFWDKIKGVFSNKKLVLTILCVVMAVILVVLVILAAVVFPKLGLINRADDDSTMSSSEYEEFLKSQTETIDPTFTGATLDPDDIDWGDHAGDLEQGDDVINILLIGQDRRAGEGRQRSDAMILCTVNIPAKTLTMTSFMRDMYVQIPRYDDNRINACYMMGGMELLDACLEKNFGVQVDGNIEVDFNGFMDIIDLLGGVDIYLNQSEANYLNRRGNWDVDDSTAGQWSLFNGVNHLTGEQALAYSRIRYIGNGDFGRTDRQRTVLNAIFEQCKELSVKQLNKLLDQLLPMLTTDMDPFTEIPGYALKLFPILKDLKIVTQRIPADGTYQDAVINGMAVLVPDLEANRKLLQQSLTD